MQRWRLALPVNHPLIIKCLRTAIGNFINIKKTPHEEFKHY